MWRVNEAAEVSGICCRVGARVRRRFAEICQRFGNRVLQGICKQDCGFQNFRKLAEIKQESSSLQFFFVLP